MIDAPGRNLRESLLERRDRLRSFVDAAPPTIDAAELDALVLRVDDTLARLEDATFGMCEVCHDPVEADRIAADPFARVCLGCLSPAESRALERDLQAAVGIQARLLPERDWRLGGWEIHYRYEPLGPVSGDHIDLVRGGPDPASTYFLFGDVSGKGVAASLLMSNLQALFRSLIHLELPLREVVERVNGLFAEATHSNAYATLVAGRIDDAGAVEIANAGHLSPFLVHAGAVTPIESTGLPIGMFATSRFRVHELRLEPDDYLLLYTDGLTEAANSAGEEYGPLRLSSALPELRGRSARAAVDVSLERLDGFLRGAGVADDLTVMAIRRLSDAA